MTHFKSSANIIYFYTTFSQYHKITQIVRKYLPVPNSDEVMINVLQTLVKYVARKVTNIGNIVSPSLFPQINTNATTWLSTVGSHTCGHTKCKAYCFAQVGNRFCSTSLPNLLSSYIICNSKWIIYLITCQECRLQYVGCTSNPLKI